MADQGLGAFGPEVFRAGPELLSGVLERMLEPLPKEAKSLSEPLRKTGVKVKTYSFGHLDGQGGNGTLGTDTRAAFVDCVAALDSKLTALSEDLDLLILVVKDAAQKINQTDAWNGYDLSTIGRAYDTARPVMPGLSVVDGPVNLGNGVPGTTPTPGSDGNGAAAPGRRP